MSNQKAGQHKRAAIGTYEPPVVHPMAKRPDPTRFAPLRNIPGLSATVSDVLDELGYRLAVPAAKVPPLTRGNCIVGPAVTLRYLPERKAHQEGRRLAHQFVFSHSAQGDVIVIEGDRDAQYSVLGGLAASHAKKAKLAGILVDGAIRDVDQIIAMKLPVWSRGISCMTGQGRLEGFSVNQPISFCGVQVCPGDFVIADDSGICFVPIELADVVRRRVLTIYEEEVTMVLE
ncbi:MAG TPA: RraA family protein [Bacillales bacterium]|nr:RraA family protein [Bacillales bacterium]